MAWGSSGGHVFPIVSLIEYLLQNQDFYKSVDVVYWLGNNNSLEQKQSLSMSVEDKISFKFVSIMSGKFRREKSIMSILRNILDIFLFLVGFFQATYFLYTKKIDTVFCKWWFVALPVVLWAKLLGKKIVMHESDVHPWLVSRIAYKFSKKVFTWFPDIFPSWDCIGQIISDKIIFQPKVSPFYDKVLKFIGSGEKTVVLVIGGSLGSLTIYNSLKELLSKNSDLVNNFNFLVVWWFLNSSIDSEFTNYDNVLVFNFVSQEEMWVLCNYSDISITRAGTTSLAEQKLYNIKMLMAPIARTHDQNYNAEFYNKNYWDIVLDQKSSLSLEFKNHLNKFIWYKKGAYSKKSIEDIQKAKLKIRQAILKP